MLSFAFHANFTSNFLCFEDKSQAIGMANIYFKCKWTKGELDLHVIGLPFQDNSQTWQQAHLCECFELESNMHIK
jgi:hypothetical protein